MSAFKTPEQIDEELYVAFEHAKSLKNSLYFLIAILFFMIIILLILFRANTGMYPKREYVYTSNAAAVCAFLPIYERGDISDSKIKNFASRIAVDLHALDYINYRSTLTRVTDNQFTDEARTAAVNALRESNILSVITEQGYVLRAIPRDAVVLIDQGVYSKKEQKVKAGDKPEPGKDDLALIKLSDNEQADGVYTWFVKVPLIFAYTSRTENKGSLYRPEKRDVTITIRRTEQSATNPDGLIISNIKSTQALD